MTQEKDPRIQQEQEEQKRRESGQPGGGAGRVEDVGHTGVYPGSGPWPPGDAPIVQPGSFGQGDRGIEGYQDAGDWSPETIHNIQRKQAEEAKKKPEEGTSEKSE